MQRNILIVLILFGAAVAANADDPQAAPDAIVEMAETVQIEAEPAFVRYEEEIQRLEADYGVYDDALAEQLLGLGIAYQSDGDHEQALEVLERAWHVRRINQGLYNLGQLNIINLIVHSRMQIRDWAGVGDAYDYIHWVYRRNYDANDPDLLPVLKRLRAWHMSAYYLDTGRGLTEHFYVADSIYRQGMRIVEAQNGDPICFWHETCCAAEAAERSGCVRRLRAKHASELDRYRLDE